MTTRWMNGFRPQTSLGGLQPFVNALFEGETPVMAEQRALQAAQMRARTRQFDAEAGKTLSEKAMIDDSLDAYRDPESFVAMITGQPRESVAAVQAGNPLAVDAWTMNDDESATRLAPDYSSVGVDDSGALLMPTHEVKPGPRKMTPEGERQARLVSEAMATFIKARMAKPNNPEQIGKDYATGVNRITTEQILGGLIAPEVGAARVAAADGKPMMEMNGAGQVINRFSGAPGPGNELLASSIAENLGQAKKYNADAAGDEIIDMIVGGRKVQVLKKDASRYGAEAAFRDPRRPGSGPKEDPLIEVEIPGRGKVKMLQSQYSAAMGRILSREDQQPVKLNTWDIRTIQGTGAAILDQLESTQNGKLPPEFRNAVIARAIELAGTPDYARNPNAAIQAAIEEMAPDGFDMSRNLFSPNDLRVRGGARTPATRATRPAVPGFPTPPATDMGGKPGGAIARDYAGPGGKKVPWSRIQETAKELGVTEQQVIKDLGLRAYD